MIDTRHHPVQPRAGDAPSALLSGTRRGWTLNRVLQAATESGKTFWRARLQRLAQKAFIQHAPAASVVSHLEVLGYPRLTEQERQHFETFFAAAPVLPLSQDILEQVVKLRQLRKITLGDALVAGTALQQVMSDSSDCQ